MLYKYAHRSRRMVGAHAALVVLAAVLTSTPSDAQRTGTRDTSLATASGMKDSIAAMAMVPDPLGVTMERLGSGTTWIPDAVSLPSRYFAADGWHLMVHGFVFGQFDAQRGARGGTQAGSLNWGMLMASHELAGGRFQARTMLSLDALGVTDHGYPLLLQTGETFHGVPLHDRQHPHDVWMELGAMYDRPVT